MPQPQPITVEDRKGMAIFFDADFRPVEREQATMMKILFENGDTMWAQLPKDEAA